MSKKDSSNGKEQNKEKQLEWVIAIVKRERERKKKKASHRTECKKQVANFEREKESE